MKALITGIAGQDGHCMAEPLLAIRLRSEWHCNSRRHYQALPNLQI